MINTNPKFDVAIVPITPIAGYTHAIIRCPRCLKNIGINRGMVAGMESIICKGMRADGKVCNGHFYLRNNQMEFVGTVSDQ